VLQGSKKREEEDIDEDKSFKVVYFIRNKGDRCKSENYSLQDGSQLCANKEAQGR